MSKKKNKSSVAPRALPKANQVKPWTKVKLPIPGHIYGVYSPFSEEYAAKGLGWGRVRSMDALAYCYPQAVYRAPSTTTEYGQLCSLKKRIDAADLACNKEYFGGIHGLQLEPRTVRTVYSGELVFFISQDEFFIRAVKDEEVILLDAMVFHLLLPVDK